MFREIDPLNTSRAEAFALWMKAPMPMVTLFKTLRVERLRKLSRRKELKFNMLLCYCIGRAASQVEEFFLLPVGERLLQYDALAVNTIVANKKGGVSSCDVPFSKSESVAQFNADYLRLTRQVAQTCENHDLGECMVIGTSALVASDIDGAVGMYSGIFNNPFLIWGRYRHQWFRTTLRISFQFHHTQMDGAHAARFLELLQQEIDGLKVD